MLALKLTLTKPEYFFPNPKPFLFLMINSDKLVTQLCLNHCW